MKKPFLFLLILLPCFLHAQQQTIVINNRYVGDDSTLKSVELILHLQDGRTITLPGLQRGIFQDDSTFIGRYPNGDRLWFPIAHSIIQNTTAFGLMAAKMSIAQTEQIITRAGIPIVREQIYFSQQTQKASIDQYLQDGYYVQVNLNWLPTNNPVPFPTDSMLIAARAEAFFKYYSPWVAKIPYVVVENEWDNGILTQLDSGYHSGTIQDYLKELSIVAAIGQKYGFRIVDAGITDGGIKQWYNGKIDLSEYFDGIKKIPGIIGNFHWYVSANAIKSFDLRAVASAYKIAAGFTNMICNEFGIRTDSPDLWQAEVMALNGFVDCAIAYSGVNAEGLARQLTSEMLSELQ